jgi:integrase
MTRVDYLDIGQVGELCRYLDQKDKEALYLAVQIMFWGGLRLSELHSLSPDDIDLDTGDIYLRHTKLDKPREVCIPQVLAERLRYYLKHYRPFIDDWAGSFSRAVSMQRQRLEAAAVKKYDKSDARRAWVHRELMLYMQGLNSPLFGVKYQAIQKALRRLPSQAGMAGPDGMPIEISPHTLRHSCAVYLLKDGRPIDRVSKYLGHSSIAITVDNYGRFASKDVKDEIRKSHPGAA